MAITDLSALVPSFKRAVAIPGQFATVFNPTPGDSDMIGALADGFAEAQLDGFFTKAFGGTAYTLNTIAETVDPGLTDAQGALVIIYAAGRFMTTMLLNLKNRQKFSAKGADYETEQSATLLTTLLKQTDARKTLLQQKALYSGSAAAFHMADGYFLAATERYWFPWIEPGFFGDPYGV